MPTEFADVVYTLTNLVVARLKADLTYDVVSRALGLGNQLSFSVKADNDQLRSYGMVARLLTILTNAEGMLSAGAVEADVLWILTGHNTTSSGSAPNRVGTVDVLAGGSGLPYFGVVGAFASEDGANALIGLRRAMLDTFPEWTVEENKFRVAETKFTAIPIDTTSRKLHRIKRNETAAAIPGDLNTFFS
jgi:hypothetical protein